MEYHIIALVAGYILDLIVGDPHWLYHPVRLIGAYINLLEKCLYNHDNPRSGNNRLRGGILAIMVMLTTGLVTAGILIGTYIINVYAGVVVESIFTYWILAGRSLEVESMAVYKALKDKGLEAGRYAVSMIVGRDTNALDETGVIKAAVETVAENASDGVIAPFLYTVIGGPVLGSMYKAINTMDSMIGYKNDRYEYFGTVAAKMDDVVNYIPARISAILICIMSLLLPGFYGREAVRIFIRDRYNHKSPNSAQTESAMAGALRVRLAGDAWYFGKLVRKPYMGDDIRPIELRDIIRANILMLSSSFLCFALCIGIMAISVL